MIKNIPDRDYYIIFRRHKWGEPTWLWSLMIWFLVWRHRDYGHMDVLWEEEENLIVGMSTSPWQIGIQMAVSDLEVELRKYKHIDATGIIKFRSITEKDNKRQRGLINCVTCTKALLGVRNPFVISPYGLYRKLLKLGGKQIWHKQQSR